GAAGGGGEGGAGGPPRQRGRREGSGEEDPEAADRDGGEAVFADRTAERRVDQDRGGKKRRENRASQPRARSGARAGEDGARGERRRGRDRGQQVRRELAPGDRGEHEDDGGPRQDELRLAIDGEPRAPQRGEEERDRREEPGEEHGDEVVDRPRAAVPGSREALEMLVDEEEVEKARVALLGEKEPGRRGEQEGRERGAGEESGKESRSAREEAPEEKDPARQHDCGQALAQES